MNEYFLSILNKFGLFYNSYHEAKYFDISSILTIDEIINQNRNWTTDQILSKIDEIIQIFQIFFRLFSLFHSISNELNV